MGKRQTMEKKKNKKKDNSEKTVSSLSGAGKTRKLHVK